jgi:hypothetical protein
MKSLSTLIKLQKTHVDEQRVALARLQARLDDIEKSVAELEIRKAREQVAAQESPESRVTYGAFLKSAVKQGRELEKERQVSVVAVEIARQKLTELFEDQKRYEIAEAARVAAEEQEERRRETKDLDEVGGMSHQRKKGG